MDIRTRLTLQFILVVTLIILFGFGVIYYSSVNYTKTDLIERLENKARTSSEIFISVKQIDSTMLRMFDRSQKDKLPFEVISIYSSDNSEVYTNNDTLLFDADKKLLDETRAKRKNVFKQNGFDVFGMTYKDKFNDFVVFAAAKDIYGEGKLKNLRNTLFVLFIIIISIVAFAGWIYSGKALKPLSDVIDEVRNINVDKMDTRLNKSRYTDEIGRLINTFNILLNRIEKAFKLQKLFVSGASHELKNPLTAITSQLQVVLLNDRSNEEYKQIIHSILEDINNLNKTTLDLIEFAKLNYENQIQVDDVRVDDVLWLCGEYFMNTHPDYKLNIQFPDMPEDETKLIVKGNAALLKIAFINLVGNACKFSIDKTCNIKLFTASGKVVLTFSDSGIGISPEEAELIFEPFYKVNSTAETTGHGIGLALTKKIVQLHQASIDVNSKMGLGTTFTVRF